MASAANGTGHIKADQDLKQSPDEPKHYFETRLVTTKTRGNRIGFVRDKITIAMPNNNQWPTYTACISCLAFQPLAQHYYENIGFRHKSTYQVQSDQGWQCRTIIWTSAEFVPFNRSNNPSSIIDNSAKHELTNFSGFLRQNPNNERKCTISWDEKYFTINPPPPQGTATAGQGAAFILEQPSRNLAA
jgi:hypothetical protein